ncbi:uncharacterized protein BDV14DRAFT_70247 [Aspergillus stella-maris]|uniref:uncharacterized protein n=1 Tax=Aspergillus stella-maris TaxID=1810926 RepID=UPI003CCDAB9D
MDFTGPRQTRPEAPTGGQLSLCVSPLFFSLFFFPHFCFWIFFPRFFGASFFGTSVAGISEPLISVPVSALSLAVELLEFLPRTLTRPLNGTHHYCFSFFCPLFPWIHLPAMWAAHAGTSLALLIGNSPLSLCCP